MAYNSINRLRKIVDIQNIYKKHSKNHFGSSTDTWIFENLISPVYHISRATFYNYLSEPASRMLNEMMNIKDKKNETTVDIHSSSKAVSD